MPFDILDLANLANDLSADYTGNILAKAVQPKLNKLQEKYGRDAFDKKFTELTGIKSDASDVNQIVGELVSLGGLAKAGKKTIKNVAEQTKQIFQPQAITPEGISVDIPKVDSKILKSEIQTKHNNIIQTSKALEKTPVKSNLALQKISKQFNKSKLDANGVPKNILKDKDGKPLILYYGDSGYTYVPPKLGEKDTLYRKTAYVDKGQPGKLIDKFSGAERIGKGNFTTTNPFLASTYASASDRGSVIPVYIMAEKVIDAKKAGVDGVMAFDKAADIRKK